MITFKEFIELAESSSPERGRRRLASRGPSPYPYERLDARRETSNRAALKKAGFKRRGSGEDAEEHQSSSSPDHSTVVTTHKTQSDYAVDNIKHKGLGTGQGRTKVTPTADRVRRAKALKKQLGGDRTSKKVHDVEIVNDTAYRKNDREDLISRGRSFKQEVKSVPKALQKAGAKPGDKVSAEPAATMRGEDPKKGKEKRDKIYTKEFKAKMNPVTGKTMGTMRG